MEVGGGDEVGKERNRHENKRAKEEEEKEKRGS